LQTLAFHCGKKRAIGRKDLVLALSQFGFDIHERMIRACINQLRKEGNIICSTGGVDGGYYLADNWEELNEYLVREVHSRAMDLLEQEKALKASGERKWGAFSPEKQISLGL